MVILIGGTGFIGKHLCVQLHQNNIPCVTLSRQPDSAFLKQHAPSIKGLVLTADFAEKYQAIFKNASTIIYLASNSIPSSKNHTIKHELDTNAAPLMTVLDAAIKLNPNLHIIYVSSGGTVYGPNHTVPVPESADTNPITPYAFGKVVAEEYIKFLCKNQTAQYTILRAANPVGKWHSNLSQGFIGAALSKLKRQQPITIFGRGNVVRDYIDVDEMADAMRLIIANKTTARNKTWNIGTGKGYSLVELVDKIEIVTNTSLEIDWQPERTCDLPYNVLDCSLIEHELKWQAKQDIDSIIQNVWLAI